MKKHADFLKALIGPVLLAGLFTWVVITPIAGAADVAGDGYATGDACGFITGTSTAAAIASGGEMNFDDADDVVQGCVNENGYFEDDGTKHSYGWSTQVGWVDFAWSSAAADATYLAQVDVTSGAWTGYAWNDTVGWLWFDWTCTGCESYYDTYRVHTDLTTGDVDGYAWNDTIGWISFDGLSQELSPLSFMADVDVFAIDPTDGVTELDPADVDLQTAPVSDGYQYYTVRMTFIDPSTGEYLSIDDLNFLNITLNETSDSSLCLNQVTDEPGTCSTYGEAVETHAINYSVDECDTNAEVIAYGGTDGEVCYIDDGSTVSFNYYVYSSSPSSSMLGVDDDADYAVDVYSDRDGTVDFYDWLSGVTTEKMLYFYDRNSARNKWALDTVDFTLKLADIDRVLSMGGATCTQTALIEGQYDCVYDLSDDPELNFKPRFRNGIFQAYYDLANHDQINTDITVDDMNVVSSAELDMPSDEYRTAHYVLEGYYPASNPDVDVNYVVDSLASGLSDYRLFMDSSLIADGVIDSASREDTITVGPYDKAYAMGYSTANCVSSAIDPCTDTATSISYETAEQWVCDWITEMAHNDASCYYTGYLELQDRHAAAEDMLAIGSINSSIDASEIVSGDDEVSVLGIPNYITLRNTMYAQAVRLVRGQTATGGGNLSSTMVPTSGSDIVSLMGGNLLFSTGDVTVNGSASYDNKTLLVIGANVYINGNIEDSGADKLGIIVFKKDGVGGNIYVSPDVTDIYANIFIDGSLFSYDGSGSETTYPTWSSDDDRSDTLMNQLYLLGSIVSRNTIGGAYDASAGSWGIGDGTTVTSLDVAREYDLNNIREFRLCYELDASGNVDESSTPADCGEGEVRSSYLDSSGLEVDAPFIVEYDPPSSDMPIFNTTSPDLNQR